MTEQAAMTASAGTRMQSMSERFATPGVLLRGGTSKCWAFWAHDLPTVGADRDALLLRLFGSPERRQIDGVGGGSSTTSKALIVEAPSDGMSTVDYQVAQVSIDELTVGWESNCGNCASGLALFAVQESLVPVTSPVTQVRLRNTRTGLLLCATVDTPGGTVPYDGIASLPGTAYPGVGVELHWLSPTWSTYGATLPTGNAVDTLHVDGRDVEVTLVDAGAPAALVSAMSIGIEHLSSSVDDVLSRMAFLTRLREVARERMMLKRTTAGDKSLPKVGIVGPSFGSDGTDVQARMVSMSAPHPTIGITSAVAVAVASSYRGSVVADAISARSQMLDQAVSNLSIGTPAGAVHFSIHYSDDRGLDSVSCLRSARRLLDAQIRIPVGWPEALRGIEKSKDAS